LLLTGRADGAPVTEIVRLLELAEREGGDEAGVRMHDRLASIRALFPPKPAASAAPLRANAATAVVS